MKFKKETLQELANGCPLEGFGVEFYDNFLAVKRGAIEYEMIFSHCGKYYRAFYC